ncbi:25537_t:CDS:2, partial [Dentiscutata erythropus]
TSKGQTKALILELVTPKTIAKKVPGMIPKLWQLQKRQKLLKQQYTKIHNDSKSDVKATRVTKSKTKEKKHNEDSDTPKSMMTPKATRKQQELQKANRKKKHNEGTRNDTRATATPKVTKITETAIHQNLRRLQKRHESNKSCKKQTEREKHNEDSDTPKSMTTPKATQKQQELQKANRKKKHNE